MYKLLLTTLVSVMWIALSACAARTPTEGVGGKDTQVPAPTSASPASPTPENTPTPVQLPTQAPTKPPSPSEGLPIEVDDIRKYLADEMKQPIEQVTLIAWQPVEWRDSCLGVHTPKVACLTVITPGYALKFQVGDEIIGVNTDATGKNFRLVQGEGESDQLPALSWSRSGGFAGVCQTLTVYSLGNYWMWDCKQGKLLAQGVLPENFRTYLSGLMEGYQSFEWKPMPPAGSADMFVDQIRFYGTGTKVISSDEQEMLNDYLAKLASELYK